MTPTRYLLAGLIAYDLGLHIYVLRTGRGVEFQRWITRVVGYNWFWTIYWTVALALALS